MSWNDQRPMSPHLQVYKLPLTARLSILHRATGVVLFVGLLLMIVGMAIAAQGAESWGGLQSFLSSYMGKLLLFCVIFSLYYHLCNGLRHLFWDIGKGLTLKATEQSNLVVIVMSIVLTLLTWFFSWFMA
jgi:succinate dehydrogenase / fumarate reductase cytochrome b subunit